MRRSEVCCICKTEPRRETISRKTGLRVKQRTCKKCAAAQSKDRRRRTLATVLPEEFWEWTEDARERWLMSWFRRVARKKTTAESMVSGEFAEV